MNYEEAMESTVSRDQAKRVFTYVARMYAREDGELNQYLMECKATSMCKAKEWARRVAEERGWRLVNVFKDEGRVNTMKNKTHIGTQPSEGARAAHTPQPWCVIEIMAKKENQYRQLAVVDENSNDVTNRASFPENLANMLLIAAAPELLEAAIYAACPKCEHDRCEGLRRAIAKAEGRK